MTDMEKEKAVLNNMRDRMERLYCEYNQHLESQQHTLEAVQEELRAYCMEAAEQVTLDQSDLQYIEAYVQASNELRMVYQAQINLCSTQYSGSKARFTDSFLADRDDDFEMF